MSIISIIISKNEFENTKKLYILNENDILDQANNNFEYYYWIHIIVIYITFSEKATHFTTKSTSQSFENRKITIE